MNLIKSRLMRHPMLMSLTLIFLITLFGCRNKTIPMDKMPPNQIVFGSGGGFAGMEKEYIMLEDGRILSRDTSAVLLKIVARISKTKAKECFDKCASLNVAKHQFNHPDNVYSFLLVKDGKNPENRIVWSEKGAKVAPSIAEFYNALMAFLPKK